MRQRRILSFILAAAAGLLITAPFAPAQKASDPAFKVKLDFNRWHDTDELYADMKRLQTAFPKFLKLESIGKSHDGRDLMLMTINNPATGPETARRPCISKPTSTATRSRAARSVSTPSGISWRTTAASPTSPGSSTSASSTSSDGQSDGRQYFMESPGGNARSGHVPVDDDNDGLFDEDAPEDINGNGIVEQIRKYVPGRATTGSAGPIPTSSSPFPSARRAITSSSAGGDRQRRRRHGQRGRPGQLRRQPELAQRLAARLRPERGHGLSLPAARSQGRGRFPQGPPEHRRGPVLP